MTITSKRSICPPNNPSRRVIVNGSGNAAHSTPAIPAVTPTPCAINVRISDNANPSVPPMKSNGKIGPPSKPVAKDVLVSTDLISVVRGSSPMPNAAELRIICSN